MKKQCYRCKLDIDLEKERYVNLSTHEGKRLIEAIYFHFNCWRLHFEEKTRQKAENIIRETQQKVFPALKEMLKNFNIS